MNPNWNSVSLQLHLNGAGGSTTFVDSSNSAHSVTAAGNAAISTAQSVFGGASLGLDGAGDYLSISSSSAFGFGTAAWTVECHVRLTALGSDRGLFDFRPGVSAAAGFFYVSSTGRLAYYDGSTVRGDAGTALSTGAWYHVAFSYDGASMRAFVNGELVDLSPTEYKLLRFLMSNANRVLTKAQILDHVWEYDFNGEMGIVESYVSYLRKKLDPLTTEPLIQTKRGVGYMYKSVKNAS